MIEAVEALETGGCAALACRAAFGALLADVRSRKEAEWALVQASTCGLVQILHVARETCVRSVDAGCAVVAAPPADSC